MTFQPKPLSCDPSRVRGMSERLIVSHEGWNAQLKLDLRFSALLRSIDPDAKFVDSITVQAAHCHPRADKCHPGEFMINDLSICH